MNICPKCKHYVRAARNGYGNISYDYCRSSDIPEYKISPINGEFFLTKCYKHNQEGNCPYYEKRLSLKERWFGWLTRGKGQTE